VTGTSAVSGGLYSGGFVGYIDTTSSAVSITDSCTLASVTGSNNFVGGFVGRVDTAANAATFSNTYAQGAVTGEGQYSGGYAGYLENSVTVSYSYASGNVEYARGMPIPAGLPTSTVAPQPSSAISLITRRIVGLRMMRRQPV